MQSSIVWQIRQNEGENYFVRSTRICICPEADWLTQIHTHSLMFLCIRITWTVKWFVRQIQLWLKRWSSDELGEKSWRMMWDRECKREGKIHEKCIFAKGGYIFEFHTSNQASVWMGNFEFLKRWMKKKRQQFFSSKGIFLGTFKLQRNNITILF